MSYLDIVQSEFALFKSNKLHACISIQLLWNAEKNLRVFESGIRIRVGSRAVRRDLPPPKQNTHSKFHVEYKAYKSTKARSLCPRITVTHRCFKSLARNHLSQNISKRFTILFVVLFCLYKLLTLSYSPFPTNLLMRPE